MFGSIIAFRIEPSWTPPEAAAWEEALGLARFVPCGTTQRESSGWVEPRGEKHGALLETVGGQLIFKLMHESKVLPPRVVKKKLDERCAKIQEQTGRKPGAKQKKELKDEVELELLPHAFTKEGATLVWLDPKERLIVVGAGSLKSADRIINLLVEMSGNIGSSMPVRLLQTNMSPSTAMAHWLTTKEPPSGFSVDRECELKLPDSEKSCVRYSRHALELDEIVEHIKQGKTPTKLAMTFNGRVSFMLNADLSLKKVTLLDVAIEDGKGQGDSGFDADVAISTGELSKMIPALVECLDGELTNLFANLKEEAASTEQGDPLTVKVSVTVGDRTITLGGDEAAGDDPLGGVVAAVAGDAPASNDDVGANAVREAA